MDQTRHRKRRRRNEIRYIPEEIVLYIFLHLPLISLLRFRCVSKQWLSLISHFITRVHKVLFFPDSKLSFLSVDQSGLVEDIDIVRAKTLRRAHRIYGSCHGLLLIGFSEDLILWNPSTHSTLASLPSCLDRNGTLISGLCYDTYNNEYKVVMVSSYESYNRDIIVSEVGSFKTKSWKQVKFRHNGKFQSGPVLNNHPHWWSSSHRSCDDIVYFDSERNKFEDLPVPPPYDDEVVDGLGILNGCLCMALLFVSTNTVELLVMEEYGVKESWTPLLEFELNFRYSCTLLPLLITNEKNCEFFVLIPSLKDDQNNFVNHAVYEETVMVRPTWTRKEFPNSTEEEEIEERSRPNIIWNIEDDDTIHKNKTKGGTKEWIFDTYSSPDVEQIATKYFGEPDWWRSILL